MGYETPDNPFDSEIPPDDGSEDPHRSNGHESEESPKTSHSEHGGDDDLPPPPDLGLPPDYDPKFIPTSSQLRKAADRRLDWETAFVLLNRDDPDEIAGRLDDMADMIRAAISVQGPPGNPERAPSLKKAVRLGLALELRYWLRANKFEAWVDLIGPLLTTAIQMEEFQPAVFLTWSIYHYMDGNVAKTKKAIEVSQQYAAESGREDLLLLVQAHQFNFDAPKMGLDEAEQTARNLIGEAQRLGYDYVRARVYFSLARAYGEQLQGSKKVFEYAQQAMAILICDSRFEMASDALTFMLGVIGIRDDHSPVYRDALRVYFGHIIEKCVNPIFQGSAYFFQGRDQHFYRGEYDEAMLPLLYAWRKYRQAYMPMNVARTLHMLGMVQTKRGKWPAAEFYLREAIKRYEAMGHKGYEVWARHAHAFIPYEYADWALTLARLENTLALAENHPGVVAQKIVDEIKSDIDHVRDKLQGGNLS